jgi:threonine/homoserine/homoserine lactone efflux protein
VRLIIFASAELFTAIKFAGAIYLIWLGIKTFRDAGTSLPQQIVAFEARRAFRDGVLVEALNPKTAAFFLAFIPQFLDPAGAAPAHRFITLGLISATINTLADFIMVGMASTAQASLGAGCNRFSNCGKDRDCLSPGLGFRWRWHDGPIRSMGGTKRCPSLN